MLNSDSMFEMSTGHFYARLGPFVERQYCCINWVLRQVSPDRLQNGLHNSHLKCWSALVCKVGT